MDFELRPAVWADRVVVDRMLEFYLYDHSEFDLYDLDLHGSYRFDDIDYYWLEKDREVWVVLVEGQWAGFALINRDVVLEGSERCINDFFIMRKYRGRGLGGRVAKALFDQQPARWELCVHPRNQPGLRFWQRVIADYTGGNFIEQHLDGPDWTGPVLALDSRSIAAT